MSFIVFLGHKGKIANVDSLITVPDRKSFPFLIRIYDAFPIENLLSQYADFLDVHQEPIGAQASPLHLIQQLVIDLV